MKFKFILFLVFSALITLTLSSYRLGPARDGGIDGTGAEGTGTLNNGDVGTIGCNTGGGCHNATTSLNTTVELDSAGVAVTSYHPGGTYTIKISATNNTTHTLPKFGFQLATVKAAGAGTASAVQAGTWSSTLPAGVQNTSAATSFLNIPIIEQNTQITANSGTGGAGTTYIDSISWTAPAAGTGAVKIYGALNAVLGNDNENNDYYQAATPVTIAEFSGSNGISAIADKLSGFNVYPTLMSDNVTIAFDLKEAGATSITMISMQGQVVKEFLSLESLSEGSFRRSFDIAGLATGVYFIKVQIGSASIVSKVVKQ